MQDELAAAVRWAKTQAAIWAAAGKHPGAVAKLNWIAAALAEPATIPAVKWQPIESAPKDGTRVLLRAEGGITEGHYDSHFWKSWLGCHDRQKVYASVHKPTHWMPLPAPPESAS